jgi:uncharacterized membrane protein HdeD (DUF308 family)
MSSSDVLQNAGSLSSQSVSVSHNHAYAQDATSLLQAVRLIVRGIGEIVTIQTARSYAPLLSYALPALLGLLVGFFALAYASAAETAMPSFGRGPVFSWFEDC